MLYEKSWLFDKEVKDPLFTAIKSEQDPWHAEAKTYWQHLYNQHSKFLDDNYLGEIGNDCINRDDRMFRE